MIIPKEEISFFIRNYPRKAGFSKRISLDKLFRRLKHYIRQEIKAHLQAPMVMLDQSVHTLIAFERFQWSFNITAERREFALQVSRVRADITSIKELLSLGHQSTAFAITRIFIEDLEVAMALAVDQHFSEAFATCEDGTDFWSKHIAYGRIMPLVRRFFELGLGSSIKADEIDEVVATRRRLKSHLSNHIHPTHSTIFEGVLPKALGKPGMFSLRPMGAITLEFAPLCLSIAEEVNKFAMGCMNMIISQSPPAALGGYERNAEMERFAAEGFLLQELCARYLSKLWDDYENASSNWKSGL